MLRLAIGLAVALSAPAFAQTATAQTTVGITTVGITMGDFTLGAPVPEGLREPLGTQVVEPFSITVWSPDDGILAMSTTADVETGDVQYVEIWRNNGQGTQAAPIEGMTFGETTRGELAERFGSEGIIFAERGHMVVIEPNVAYFTSYEIEGSDAVVSFVTIQPLAEASVETINDAVLDSISIGTGPYLDLTWGANRGRLQGYERITDPFAE